jgi:hypothetical protein
MTIADPWAGDHLDAVIGLATKSNCISRFAFPPILPIVSPGGRR